LLAPSRNSSPGGTRLFRFNTGLDCAVFSCLLQTTYEHRHTALGKGKGKTGRHSQDAWTSRGGDRMSLFGRPGFGRSFALEMSCVNSWSERKARKKSCRFYSLNCSAFSYKETFKGIVSPLEGNFFCFLLQQLTKSFSGKGICWAASKPIKIQV
jgi:hypothetical protein